MSRFLDGNLLDDLATLSFSGTSETELETFLFEALILETVRFAAVKFSVDCFIFTSTRNLGKLTRNNRSSLPGNETTSVPARFLHHSHTAIIRRRLGYHCWGQEQFDNLPSVHPLTLSKCHN